MYEHRMEQICNDQQALFAIATKRITDVEEMPMNGANLRREDFSHFDSHHCGKCYGKRGGKPFWKACCGILLG